MKNQEVKKPTAVDFLNSEWAQILIQANNKIALLTEENDKLKNALDKQEELISALEENND